MSLKRLSDDKFGFLLLTSAVVLGGWMRLSLPAQTQFPIGDGGLFYKMIETLQNNNFALPLYVTYNNIDIPFAYPPLALYLAAWLGKTFHLSILSILTWMPAIVLTIAILLFYMLSNLFLKSRLQAGLASLIYALTPRSTTWLIMGGGITRSVGHLLQILALSQIYLLFKTGQQKYLFSSILFSTGICLSHPEATLHTAGIAALLWFFYGRNRQGFLNACLVGLGTLAITAPWWVTVMSRFGLDAYIAAMQTGRGHIPSAFIMAFLLPYNGESLLTTILLFSLIGLLLKIKQKDFFLPSFFVLPFILEPRNAPNVYILPMAMLASIFITEFLLPGLEQEVKIAESTPAFSIRWRIVVMTYLLIALFSSMVFSSLKLIEQNTVSPDMRMTAEWIRKNTPPSSRILLISGEMNLLSDFDNEWLPLLTNRTSLTTIQGTEWLPNFVFQTRSKQNETLQTCLSADEPYLCIQEIFPRKDFDYILVKHRAKYTSRLIYSLIEADDLLPVYSSKDAIVFERKQPRKTDTAYAASPR